MHKLPPVVSPLTQFSPSCSPGWHEWSDSVMAHTAPEHSTDPTPESTHPATDHHDPFSPSPASSPVSAAQMPTYISARQQHVTSYQYAEDTEIHLSWSTEINTHITPCHKVKNMKLSFDTVGSSSSSFGACRWRSHSRECAPGSSVLCLLEPWCKTEVERTQVCLHRSQPDMSRTT